MTCQLRTAVQSFPETEKSFRQVKLCLDGSDARIAALELFHGGLGAIGSTVGRSETHISLFASVSDVSFDSTGLT